MGRFFIFYFLKKLSIFPIIIDEIETVSRPSNNTCIENFPDEILIEIFTYLSGNDLKRIMMTSRVFCDIVTRSSKLMKKFMMKISPKRRWDFESLMGFERIHQNVKIVEFKSEDEPVKLVIDGLWNIGKNVKFLELNDCEIPKDNFVKILKTMEMLEKIDLLNVKISDETHDNLPDFKNLKVIKIVECNSVFEIFRLAANICEICFQADDRQNLSLQSFEELLSQQKKLTCLELINIKFSDFLGTKQTFPFQLTSLTIHECHFNERENFEHFLASQRNLEEVELTVNRMKLNLDRLRYFEGSLLVIVKLKNLKKLSLEIEDYNFANMNFLHQAVNPKVDHLKLSVEKASCQITSILRVFPNLNSLDLSIKDIDQGNIDYINKNLQKLQSLKISKFPSELFGKFKIKNLKSLHVNETNIELENWTEFTDNHLNITKLIINFTFFIDLSDDFIDKVTKKLTKLEHVELIDKWIGMKNEIYLAICENSKNLKYLKLWNINVEKNFDESDKEFLRDRNIKFHLYNDESLNTPMIPF